VSPCVVDGRLKVSCPLYVLLTLTGASTVLTEPRSVLVVVSYASPTAYSELLEPLVGVQLAETGTCMLMF